MTNQKSLLLVIAEWWEERQAANPPEAAASPTPRVRRWLPTPGSVLFTLLAIGGLVWAQSVGAVPGAAPASPDVASTGTVAYQGRLANPAGAPLTGTYGMIFRLYSGAAGGTPLWEEQWTGPNSVQVSDGLFNVMLGSLAAIPQSVMTGNSSLWLGITVGSDDEMTPRVQIGSVPFAVQAQAVPESGLDVAGNAGGLTIKHGDGTFMSFRENVNSTLLWTLNRLAGTNKLEINTSPSGGDIILTTGGGRVGIGTTGPDRNLEIYDNTDSILKLSGNQTSDATFAELELHNRAGARSIVAALRDGANGSSKLVFYNQEGGVDQGRMVIRANGNVGIGAGSPGNILTIQQGSATDPIADGWTTYSSRRWKTRVEPIHDALGMILRLRGVSFDWRASGRSDLGLIAEEVGEVIPEVVAYEANRTDARSVDYTRLVPILIEATKEQQKQIDRQQVVIDGLASENRALRADLDALAARIDALVPRR